MSDTGRKSGIDAKTLANVLKHTFNPEIGPREAAEKELKSVEGKPGYLEALLKLMIITEIPEQVRQAASIRLKNIVSEYWSIRKGDACKISEQDRKIVKDNILEATIFQTHTLLRTQLLECIFKIARNDFPDSWPEILPAIMKNVNSGNKQRVYGAVCALRMIYKRFRFTAEEKRTPVDRMIVGTFPTLLKLFKSVYKNTTVESFEMCRQLIKIFFLSTQLSLPTYLRDPANFTPWMQLCLEMFETPLPADQTPSDTEGLCAHPLWKCKKWAALIFNRLFSRYGHPKQAEDDEKEFATMFFGTFAEPLMGTFLKMLKFKKEGGLVTPRVLQLCYNYLYLCVSYSKLYKKMKTVLNFLLLESILPTLMLTPDDLAMWSDNPNEFVRRSMDIMEEFFNPRVAANNLLCEIVKIRTKDSLQLVLKAVQDVMAMYAKDKSEKNALIKEGAMRMFGGIKKYLLSKPSAYAAPIEKLLVTHVFPEFKSPHNPLRATSCWLVGQYAKLKWSKAEHGSLGIKAVTACLADKELPVRLEAAIAVSRIVCLAGDQAVDLLRPHVKTILEQYFLLIDEIGTDEVIRTLADFIDVMGKDAAPFALHIVTKMTTMFGELTKADPEDDEAAITAGQCLGTITVMLYASESLPEMYPALEKPIAPLLDKLVSVEGIEFFEDTLEVMTCLTYFPKQISDFMWTLLPRILGALDDWAADYVGNVVPPVDNYISKGTTRFFASTSPNYLQLVLAQCKKLYEREEHSDAAEADCTHAAHLLETIIAHGKGKIDKCMPDIFKLVTAKLFEAKTAPLKLVSLDVVSGIVYYNPALFLNLCKAGGESFVKTLFNNWLSCFEHMKGYKQRKMTVLGLSSLFTTKRALQPKVLQKSFDKVFVGLLGLLQAITEAKNEAKEGESDDDDQEVEEFVNLDDDKDAEDELQSISTFTKKVRKGMAASLAEESQIADDEFQSPYDEIDEFVYWASALQEMTKIEPTLAAQLQAALDAKQKAAVTAHIEEAKKRKVKQEEKAKEEKSKPKTTTGSSGSGVHHYNPSAALTASTSRVRRDADDMSS